MCLCLRLLTEAVEEHTVPLLECITHNSFEQVGDWCLRGYDDGWNLPAPHGTGACPLFITLWTSFGNRSCEGRRPAVVSWCTSPPLSEQFPVDLMMHSQKKVGVAHLRAFRNHWTRTQVRHARVAQEDQRAKRCKECVRIPTHITTS